MRMGLDGVSFVPFVSDHVKLTNADDVWELEYTTVEGFTNQFYIKCTSDEG